jgi:hypothetical protein
MYLREEDEKQLHNDELYHIFSSLIISTIIKSMRMRRAGLIVEIREMKNAY